MTAAEKKRAKQKARKAAQKAKKLEEQEALAKKKAQEEAAKEGKKRMRKLPVDKDPDGTTAFAEALKCPLEKANSLVSVLTGRRRSSTVRRFRYTSEAEEVCPGNVRLGACEQSRKGRD